MPKLKNFQQAISGLMSVALSCSAFSPQVSANPIIANATCHALQLKENADCLPLKPRKRITWDTERENHHTVYGGRAQCEIMRKNENFGKILEVIPEKGGAVTCVFEGRQTNFGGGD